MYTYQMVGVADQNGRTYECKYGTYSKEKGFVFPYEYIDISFVNKLFHEDLWSLKVEPKKMTLSEVEKELGYPVEITDFKSGLEEFIKSLNNI